MGTPRACLIALLCPALLITSWSAALCVIRRRSTNLLRSPAHTACCAQPEEIAVLIHDTACSHLKRLPAVCSAPILPRRTFAPVNLPVPDLCSSTSPATSHARPALAPTLDLRLLCSALLCSALPTALLRPPSPTNETLNKALLRPAGSASQLPTRLSPVLFSSLLLLEAHLDRLPSSWPCLTLPVPPTHAVIRHIPAFEEHQKLSLSFPRASLPPTWNRTTKQRTFFFSKSALLHVLPRYIFTPSGLLLSDLSCPVLRVLSFTSTTNAP